MSSEQPHSAHHDFLHEAIDRNGAVVLSLPSAGILRHHKSRFLADAGDGFWVESVVAERPLVDELVVTGKPVGISFKSGVHKVVLAAPVRRREAEYRINADTTVEAILLPYPETVKAIQRRNNYRVRVVEGSNLSVRIWRIPERAHLSDRPMAAQAVDADLFDLSLGGLGVVFRGQDGLPPKVSPEDRLRIELTYRGAALLLEGRMRHPVETPKDPACRAGVGFKALDGDIEGRQKLAQLTRIVGEMQRDEARRARLGA